ncbi:MAG: GIY-YIG nuclease family protein [Alphaproteobacteria bacterium]|nr:GIY-YIG nuclease family protein [Alphaproteobacteria bacterium]
MAEQGGVGGTRARPKSRERGGAGGQATSLSLSDGVAHHALSGNSDNGVFGRFKVAYKIVVSNDKRIFQQIYNLKDCLYTKPCDNTRCKTCPYVSTQRLIRSAVTGRLYSLMSEASCVTKKVVYLLSCKKCNMQYVGETIQRLRERFSQHKNAVLKKKNNLLYRHFNQAGHSVDDMQICILETITESDVKIAKSKLLEAENFWIRTLISAHPFGLNDKVKGYGNASDIFDPTAHNYAPYFCMPTPRRKRGHGVKRRSCKQVNKNLLQQLNELVKNTYSPAGIRNLITFLRKQSNSTLSVCRVVRDNSICLPQSVRIIVLAFVAGYFSQTKPGNAKSNDCYRLCVDFPNKGMELIGFCNIFKDRKLRKIIPIGKISEVKPVSVVYKYEPPFSRKLCNYSACLREIMEGKYQDYINGCPCELFPKFVYSHTGHVLTGDLSIVSNNQLRELFAKGAKYRIPQDIVWDNVKKAATKGMFQYLQYLLRKKIIDAETSLRFQERFMQIVYARIHQQKSSDTVMSCYYMPYILRELRKFHALFVTAPADKASNNIVVVCKYWYFKIMCDELGVSCDANGSLAAVGNATYKPANDEAAHIIDRHCCKAGNYGLAVSNTDKRLPRMFAIPKLHKSPYGWRFIAGARLSSTKCINQMLHLILCHFRRHFKNYCASIERNNGSTCYWSIDNSVTVKDKLMALGTKQNLHNLVSADFSTLFTTLPHHVIKQCLFAITDKCFNNSGKPYICVDKNYVKYVADELLENGECFRPEGVKQLISDVIDETFVQFAGITFHQVCGIPMGSSSSPLLADLTLTYLEFQFLNGNKDTRIWGKRYIDDLLVANCPQFMQIAKDIYPAELPLKRTNETADKAVFLDLSLEIASGQCQSLIYDKTDSFPFKVIKYGFADSNVHTKVGLGTFYSSLVRFGRITDSVIDFEGRVQNVFLDFIRAGFERQRLICKFSMFVNKFRPMLSKFGLVTQADYISFVQRVFFR